MSAHVDDRKRALQSDARAWKNHFGKKYVTARREVRDPLAQGVLGERISARHLLHTLDEHPAIGAHGGPPVLSSAGFRASGSGFDDPSYVTLALVTDALRMFAPVPAGQHLTVSSYSLKHVLEVLLAPVGQKYVSNGEVIWAAAALGLPLTIDSGPNALIGISAEQFDYVRRSVLPGTVKPRATHHRPVGFEPFREFLRRFADGGYSTHDGASPHIVPTGPFNEWLVAQAGRVGTFNRLARDYATSIADSEHRIATDASDLLALLREEGADEQTHREAALAIKEWLTVHPDAEPVRTKLQVSESRDVGGWATVDEDVDGVGSIDRLEYTCPCGTGTIIEEHDNIPGHREHSVEIVCPLCRTLWTLAPGRSVRDWALEPIVTA